MITLGIFQTGVMPTDLLFCNQCKVVKVVHGDRSDDHYNQSDTWRMMAIYHCYSTRALLVLVVVLSLLSSTSHTHTNIQTNMHTHACTHAHTHKLLLLCCCCLFFFFFCSQSTKHLADFFYFGGNINADLNWEILKITG